MALISLAGIAEAIDNLNSNEATLKGQLLKAIRARFSDAESLDTVTSIDPLDLIHELWGCEDAAEVKAKRKNLSSLKSSINKSLKDGIASGANPEGIIIGRDNVFIIADEKKNQLLDNLSIDGEGGSSLLSALATLNALLSGAVSPNNQSEALKIIDQLDAARKSLSKLAGLPEEGSADGKPTTGGDADGPMAVEEFEIDDDTVIEFIDEEITEPDQQGAISETSGITGSEAVPSPMEDRGRGDLESGGHANLPGDGLAGRGPGRDDTGLGKGVALDIPSDGDTSFSGAQEEWDSFEVVDDDFDIVEQDPRQEETNLENGASAGDDVDIIEDAEDFETEEDLELAEEIDTEEVLEDELTSDSTSGDGDDNTDAVGGSAGPGPTDAEDWESFEVVDDDFDIVEQNDLNQQDVESLEATVQDDDDFDIIEEVEDVEVETDLEPVEEIDTEDVVSPSEDGAEIIADQSVVDAVPNADMNPLAEGNGDAEGNELGGDWDSFEVVDEDFDIVDQDDLPSQEEESLEVTAPDEDDLAIIEEVEEVLEGETDLPADQDLVAEGDGEEVELEEVEDVETEFVMEPDEEITDQEIIESEEDVEEIAEEKLSAAPAQSTDMELEKSQPEISDADWDSFEIIEDDFNFSHLPATGENLETIPSTPPLNRSMDLSQYIDAEEALANNPDILQERNDEYIKQILERFMPKFIRIPKGLYPVGDRKKRKTDRPATKVNIAEFYIGQFPITNDLFDFFVRETGYETEAERIGHGLVTSGRLRNDLNQKTGTHTLAISKGIITRQIKGANWRHPDGPASSLENRSHHPVVQVSRLDAIAFATWAGKRLPCEDEWEVAARGKEGFLLPWGNEFLPLANLETQQAGSTTPVNYFGRQSMSPFGLLDMLGNVFEWTSSSYSDQNGREHYILKGGSWATSKTTCADRLIEQASTWSNTIGFRCAVNAD